MVAHGADDGEHDGGQKDVLQEVNEGDEEVGAVVARKARDVEDALPRLLVYLDGKEHDEDGQDDRGDDEKDRGQAAPEPVLPLVLALRRVDAQAHANHDGEDG